MMPVLATVLIANLFLDAPLSPRAQTRPSDFAIRFEFGLCSTDLIDTFKGVFIRGVLWPSKATSIPLTLSSESLEAMYHEIVAGRFNEYPEIFGVRGTGGFAPAWRYSLETRINGVTHSVWWLDGETPSNPDADRLRDMFTRLISIVTQHPDVRRLPVTSTAGCG